MPFTGHWIHLLSFLGIARIGLVRAFLMPICREHPREGALWPRSIPGIKTTCGDEPHMAWNGCPQFGGAGSSPAWAICTRCKRAGLPK
nr:MAG TPA: hypothetical protein [Bacteriophage sp.]